MVHRAPGLPKVTGTGGWSGARRSSAPSTLGTSLKPHKCIVLSLCFLKQLVSITTPGSQVGQALFFPVCGQENYDTQGITFVQS